MSDNLQKKRVVTVKLRSGLVIIKKFNYSPDLFGRDKSGIDKFIMKYANTNWATVEIRWEWK